MMPKLGLICLLLFICVWPVSARAGILNIQEVVTPKGLKVWLVEDHTVPVISLKFAFKHSGAVNDPADKQGLARLLSNTLDEGAGDLDSKAFQGQLNDLSISLIFSSTRDDFGGGLKTLSKNRDAAFNLLKLALTSPRFDQEAIERMREANLSRIRSDMTDPEWMVARIMNDELFKQHPYAMNSGGTLTSLEKITATDLRKKVKEQLTRDRLLISIAGDIRQEDVSAIIDGIFGDLPETAAALDVAPAPFPAGQTSVLFKKDIPQSVIQIALPGIAQHDPDYFAAEIMNYTLGGAGFGSRLTEVVREQRGLTYGIYSGLTEMDFAQTLNIGSSTKNTSVNELIDLTKAELLKMTNQPITADELNSAKTYLIGSVPLDLTSTDSITSYMLGFQASNLPKNYLDIREAGLKAVTATDVQRVAKRLFNPEQMLTIIVGNPDNFTASKTVTQLPNVE